MDGFLGWGIGSFQIKFAKARTTILGVLLLLQIRRLCPRLLSVGWATEASRPDAIQG